MPLPRAQSWEDPGLLAALELDPAADVLVFEPSGDDALALAGIGARAITVVTPDEAARALVALKLVAARDLPVQSVRSLLGLGHFGRRLWFYHYLRPGLSPEHQAFFDAHEGAIRAGLAGQGELERAMATLRERVLPLVLDRDALPALRAAPTAGARGAVLRERWSGIRWAAAARVWLPRLARLAGAPPDGAVRRFMEALERAPLDEGFPAAWLLTGAWAEPDRAHPWLSTAGFAAVRPRVGVVRAIVGARDAVLRGAPRGSVDAVVLGRAPLVAAESAALASALRPGGRALTWTPGDAPLLPSTLVVDAPASARLRAVDRGIFPGSPWLVRRT